MSFFRRGSGSSAKIVRYFSDLVGRQRPCATAVIDEGDLQFSKAELIAAFESEIALVASNARSRPTEYDAKHLRLLESLLVHVELDVHRVEQADKEFYRYLLTVTPHQQRQLAENMEHDPASGSALRRMMAFDLKYQRAGRSTAS